MQSIKKSLLVYCLLFSVSYLIQAQPCTADLSRGLVAYYPFTSNARDSSGNNNHGTVNEATLTTDRFGRANNAYDFNGTTSFISANGRNLMLDTLSISVWINPRENQKEYTTILDKSHSINGDASGSWSIEQASNERAFYFQYGPAFENIYGQNQKFSYTINTWQHFVITKLGNSVKNYVNGALFSSYIYNSANIKKDSSPLIIGNGVSWDRFFNGKIDDIRIYNRSLTDCEVMDLYNREKLLPTANNEIEDNLFTLYPNPTNMRISISVPNTEGGLKELKILNSTGRIHFSKSIMGNQTEIDISALANGLYFLTIETINGRHGIKKFIKN